MPNGIGAKTQGLTSLNYEAKQTLLPLHCFNQVLLIEIRKMLNDLDWFKEDNLRGILGDTIQMYTFWLCCRIRGIENIEQIN